MTSSGILPRARSAATRLARALRYRLDRLRARPAGDAVYRFVPGRPVERWCFELRLPPHLFEDGKAWASRQTLEYLRVTDGARTWSCDSPPGDAADAPEAEQALFVYAPGDSLPEVDAAFAEAAMLMLAAEDVDALVFSGSRGLEGPPVIESIDDLERSEIRPWTVFRGGSAIRTAEKLERAKILLPRLREPDAPGAPRSATRRGSYLARDDWGPRAILGLRDASLFRRRPAGDDDPRPRMLVLVPFLARGGAEHTIFETLHALKDRWQIAFATLAPHRPELDDRRPDFQRVWPRLLSLGDFVHPAAMPGMLTSLLDAFEPQVLYNANSTTLFFDFLPALRRSRPEMLVIDHLYDHRVGYIERYADPGLRGLVDSIVAENRRIQEALVERYDWPAEHAPVVWPCGRPAEAFPPDPEKTRREVRAELGLDAGDVVILTAARMHEQKRPLDLVRLAERVCDLEKLFFLVVGGGPLEESVDRAVAEATERGARTRRLPFRDDIPRLIQACDAGCLVSDYEGLPVFLLECMQAGKPFLGTDVGDLGFVLRGTGAGWVVDEPGDLDALEAAARRLHDPAERRTRGEAALAAAPRFSVEACAERYDIVFHGETPSEIELGDG